MPGRPEIPLTVHERRVIRHALGWNGKERWAYRNYYEAEPETEPFTVWEALRARGLAIRWFAVGCSGFKFSATEEAARAARQGTEGFDPDVLRHFKKIARTIEKENA